MNRIQFIVHIQDDRSSPYLEWRDALPAKDRLKLDATILKISQYGLGVALKMQWAKKLDADIWEIRSQHANNIQRVCIFHRIGDQYVITHGFTKKTQKTPRNEIKKAHDIMRQYQ